MIPLLKGTAKYLVVATVYYAAAVLLSSKVTSDWIVGYFVVAQLGGHLFAGALYATSGNKSQRWSSLLTGAIERSFFCFATANNVGGSAVAMIGWTTLKHASYIKAHIENSGQSTEDGGGEKSAPENRDTRLINVTLLSSVASLFFAMLGGAYCKGGAVQEEIDAALAYFQVWPFPFLNLFTSSAPDT